MPLETYRERIADSRHPRGVRQRLVQHYLERRSVSLTARAFRCDRKTVRLWVQRYQQGGWAALLDRRSHHSPPVSTPLRTSPPGSPTSASPTKAPRSTHSASSTCSFSISSATACTPMTTPSRPTTA